MLIHKPIHALAIAELWGPGWADPYWPFSEMVVSAMTCRPRLSPAGFRNRLGLAPGIKGMGARRIAIECSVENPLQDCRKAEHAISEIKIPFFGKNRSAPDPLAIPVDAVYEQTCLCELHPDHWRRYAAQLHLATTRRSPFAATFDGADHILQIEIHQPQLLCAAATASVGGKASQCIRHRQIDAGTEMGPGAGQDGHSYRLGAVTPVVPATCVHRWHWPCLGQIQVGEWAVLSDLIVGVKEDYRGETVKAVVSLQPGMSIAPEELISFCKERMAVYKYRRKVIMGDELTKTATGKIFRREPR